MDKIIIKGLKIFAYHGVNPEEKQNGQTFEIDAILETSLLNAGNTDNINNTISYAKAAKIIKSVVTGESYDLLETVATKISNQLLHDFPSIDTVCITVKKPEAPINLTFDYMAVEITRTRKSLKSDTL
mgnify:CR=1 FL=1